MDNSDFTLDGFDPDSLDNLAVPLRRPSGQRLKPEADTYYTSPEPPAADNVTVTENEVQPAPAPVNNPRPAQVSRAEQSTQPAQPAQGAQRRHRVSRDESRGAQQSDDSAVNHLADQAADFAGRAVRAAGRAGNAAGQVLDSMDLSIPTGWIRDGRLSKMFGCVLIMIALYTFIVTLSFFQTGAADQSVVMALEQSGMALPEVSAQTDNVGRITGALLSYNFVARSFGIGSFAIIYLIAALGLAFMRVRRFNIFSLTAKSLLSAIALSVIAGYVSMHFVSTFHWGGLHGLYLNELVDSYSGELGMLFLSLLLLAVVIVIFLKDITAGIKGCVVGYRNLRSAVTKENRRRRAREVAEAREAAFHKAAMERASQPEPQHSQEEKPVAAPVQTPVTPASTPAPVPPVQTVASTPEKVDPQPEVLSPLPDTVTIDENLAKAYIPEPIVLASTVRDNAPDLKPELEEVEDFDIEDDIDDDLIDDSATPYVTQPATLPVAETAAAISVPEIDTTPGVGEPSVDSVSQTVIPPVPPVSEKAETPVETPVRKEPEVIVRQAPEIKESDHINSQPYDPTAELSHYRYPTLDILHERETRTNTVDLAEQEENKQRLVATLGSFGIGVSQIEATIGPTVTLYEIVPSEGVRIARIKALENDLARAISAIGTRIIAPIPGRDTVGIEVPNKDPQVVPIRTILASEAYQNTRMELPMAMGVTIDNTVYLADLCKMPHLLVAGATGMGKSVGLNTIIASLLYKKHPAELKFVLVDPKMVEFSLYRRLENHYLAKLPDQEDAIITDPMQVIPTLNSLCLEMDNRYMLLKDAYVRNITEYNSKFIQRRLNPQKGHRFLPYIVVVVDEFADLIMTAGKEVEQPIARIAQKARAVGIHLILATQRPSTNVITGIIKANFPGRIAFRVFQMVDSRTILDRPGANQLIGRGDMLFSRDGVVDRVQCAFIDTDEVDGICEAISQQQGYAGPYELPEVVQDNGPAGQGHGNVADMDPYFADAGRYVVGSGLGSTSAIQRHFNIGYPRAGKIMDQLEQAGVVGPVVGAKPRAVLMDPMSFESYLDTLNQ